MDLNALNQNGAGSAVVASPVVPVPESPKPQSAKERPKWDVVELTSANRVKAAENPLIIRNSQNVRSGSRVYHDEATNQFVIQIVNDQNEVIRQLPEEQALRIAAKFREVTGLIFDQSI
ncbi:MAG: flagellar protein FlaG [Candidatus Hydrogenedentota bacterium]